MSSGQSRQGSQEEQGIAHVTSLQAEKWQLCRTHMSRHHNVVWKWKLQITLVNLVLWPLLWMWIFGEQVTHFTLQTTYLLYFYDYKCNNVSNVMIFASFRVNQLGLSVMSKYQQIFATLWMKYDHIAWWVCPSEKHLTFNTASQSWFMMKWLEM